MFTNWLTNSVPTTTAANTDVVNASLTETSHTMSNAALAVSAVNSTSSVMSTPPDVILEVGPAPSSVRFVAHSIVLGMHSGYLRSAIRLDEQVASNNHSSADLVLYLSNVSAEQFAPLLTYMYTGYLDLNVENIFGVLLATHLLHMPRALEICRSFLARAQSEGYLSSNTLPAPNAQNNGKIIRPIPSKATLPNFGFIAPPITHHMTTAALPPPAITFKSLPHTNSYQPSAAGATPLPVNDTSSDIAGQQNLTRNSESNGGDGNGIYDDDDDEEVFIDSHDESATASPEIECNISVASSKDVEGEKEIVVVVTEESNVSPARHEAAIAAAAGPTSQSQKPKTSSAATAKRDKHRHSRHNHKQRRSNNKTTTLISSNGGLQVAKAPILASELVDQERTVTATTPAAAVAESSKVIIDVASCDGPVRFRRILNTAYGHKPPPESNGSLLPPLERTQQSVSLSFHQQMAKAISQQRQLQHAEESENSESSGSGCGGGGAGGNAGNCAASSSKSGGASSKANSSNEIYVCVYCKHSFKSQYCYQKHAKRHLNPLSLNCGNTLESSVCGGDASSSRISHNKEVVREAVVLRQSQVAAATTSTSAYQQTVLPTHVAHKQHTAAAELLRREVRPLDMNVQYYPCKTCGSKFPSYYFVHKHRKLCHADEEAHEAENRRSGSSAGGGGGTTHKKVG